jgi:nitroimidazol reductase NimA-like FMN-containing flavoprotein (pyridoxamine 5'-phosphate oxidase superfamily)
MSSPPDVSSVTPSTGSRVLNLDRSERLRLLGESHFGRVAVALGDDAPVIRPVNYVFDPRSQSVVFRTASGSKLHALVHAAKAAFEVDEVGERTRTGWSVIIEGVTAEITAPTEVRRLDGLGLEPWAPGPKPHWVPVRAWTVSGRRVVRPRDCSPGR